MTNPARPGGAIDAEGRHVECAVPACRILPPFGAAQWQRPASDWSGTAFCNFKLNKQ
jgi:hypothetical protein